MIKNFANIIIIIDCLCELYFISVRVPERAEADCCSTVDKSRLDAEL